MVLFLCYLYQLKMTIIVNWPQKIFHKISLTFLFHSYSAALAEFIIVSTRVSTLILTIDSSRIHLPVLCYPIPLPIEKFPELASPLTNYAAITFAFSEDDLFQSSHPNSDFIFFYPKSTGTYHARCARACGLSPSWGLTGMKMKQCWWLFWRLLSHHLPPRHPPHPESFQNIPCCWAAQENLVGL